MKFLCFPTVCVGFLSHRQCDCLYLNSTLNSIPNPKQPQGVNVRMKGVYVLCPECIPWQRFLPLFFIRGRVKERLSSFFNTLSLISPQLILAQRSISTPVVCCNLSKQCDLTLLNKLFYIAGFFLSLQQHE